MIYAVALIRTQPPRIKTVFDQIKPLFDDPKRLNFGKTVQIDLRINQLFAITRSKNKFGRFSLNQLQLSLVFLNL